MRPFASSSSSGSISQTDFAYQTVSQPAKKAQRRGRPLLGQKQGTEPNISSRIQYTLDSTTVRSGPLTSLSIGMLTLPYSPERYSARAQKCGGVHRKISKKSIQGIGEPKSKGFIESRVLEAAAAHPIRGGVAPAIPQITIF